MEGPTDECTVDVQVQELENFLGVVRNLDERSIVDWTHFERLAVIGDGRLKTEFRQWMMQMVRWRGEGPGDRRLVGLYTKMNVGGRLRSMKCPQP